MSQTGPRQVPDNSQTSVTSVTLTNFDPPAPVISGKGPPNKKNNKNNNNSLDQLTTAILLRFFPSGFEVYIIIAFKEDTKHGYQAATHTCCGKIMQMLDTAADWDCASLGKLFVSGITFYTVLQYSRSIL